MIYLDNAATTRADERACELALRYNTQEFYNPSALYGAALDCGRVVSSARAAIAAAMGAQERELIFTASGSESDNIALLCSIKRKSGRVLVGACEHSAVHYAAAELAARGYRVEQIPCDRYGAIRTEALTEMLGEDVVLASVMHVCNETGAVNDLTAIAAQIRRKAPEALFHSDGVQAFGKIPVDVKKADVDLYSVSAHKLYAPKGVGALYIRKGVRVRPFVFGGGQEFGIRSATENVGGIAAFAYAVERAAAESDGRAARARTLQRLTAQGLACVSDARINTDTEHGSPYLLSVSFAGTRGEVLVHCLESDGILIGTGSACSSNKKTGRIAKALGMSDGYAQGTVRISFGKDNTEEEIAILIEKLTAAVAQQRNYQRR